MWQGVGNKNRKIRNFPFKVSRTLSLVLVSMGNLCHVKIIHVVLQLGGVINELLHMPRVSHLRCIRACTLNVCALKETF